MTGLVVVLLTAIPVGACGYLGFRMGGPRLARRIGVVLIAGACGAAVGFAGMAWGWSWPFGLLTPACCALLAAAGAWIVAMRRVAADGDSVASARSVGAGLGALCGVMIAGSLWIVAALGEGVAASPAATKAAPPATHGWTHALVRTANRGFVRHLPLLGPLGDEVEATIAILNSPPEARRKLARARRFDRLTQLGSYRTLAADEEVSADLDSVRRGNVLALYRLQRNPNVVAFMQEDEVRALLPSLRPSTLVNELER